MKETLLNRLRKGPLLNDGAMGTQLQLAGLEAGGCGEAWNIEHPDRVMKIQRGYVDAGSDCLTTNTFGGSRITLARHGRAGDAVAINQASVRIAREAFGGKPGYVIGDIGPFGGLMEPYGEVPAADVKAAFAEQAQALMSAGADALIVETQTSFEELALGIEAAREAGCPCIIASMAYDVGVDSSDIRTMMGIDPRQAGEFIAAQGAHIAALNCGTGMNMECATKAVELYREVCALPIMAQPNAGQPVLEKMKVVYKETPEHMAAGATALLDAGANIIGGCCGSTPAHIAAMRKVLDAWIRAH